MISNNIFWFAVIGICILYVGFRIIIGRVRFKETVRVLNEEGLLRSQHGVLIRINFPLVKRITFTHVYLSKRRLMLFYALSRCRRVQAPLGPLGRAGNENGRFEVERKGKRSLLTLKAAMWGGGRIRMHVKDAEGWLKDIKAHGKAGGKD